MTETEKKFYDLLSHIIIDDNEKYFLNESIIEMYADSDDENLLKSKLNAVIIHLNENIDNNARDIDILFENF